MSHDSIRFTAPKPVDLGVVPGSSSSFQFPKSLLLPCLKPWMAMVDRGWMGPPRLETHLVICGFPRSGTSLCQLMIETCVEDIHVYGKERRGLEAAKYGSRKSRFMMTKRPRDIFVIDEIRDYYRERSANVRFVLFQRDPRSILTSRHADRPGEYYVSAERWRVIDKHWQEAAKADDVISIRYEDLVSDPDHVETQLTQFVGWQVHRPFATAYRAVPQNFKVAALNGVRKLDPGNCDRWANPEHQLRLAHLVQQELPTLPERIVELGYEFDDAWTRSLPRAA